MTECERLVSEGFIPEDFLKPEVRNEAQVPAELKKTWAVQLDLLRQVQAICERHGLKYFAICGTALGAWRHNGFIPWDDDMDIALPRKDYNALIGYCPKELDGRYFLQAVASDPYFYRPFAVLRNSNTTCISGGDQRLKCNNGIMIHIFPLDGFTESKKLRRYIRLEHIRSAVAVNACRPLDLGGKKFIRLAERILQPVLFGGSLKAYARRHEAKCTRISEQPHEFVGTQYAHFLNVNKVIWKKEWFDSQVWVPFEFITIPLPAGYDEMLHASYKKPEELPAPEKRVYRHSWEIEPDVPYKVYCHAKYKVNYED